jgi:gag-polypeptide of LTR copia-type/Integrase core domain/GAG-pre-integrase domain/Zinc knuckle
VFILWCVLLSLPMAMNSEGNTIDNSQSASSGFEHGIGALAKLPLLKGNYVTWRFKMEHALRVRRLWAIVNGEERRPEVSPAKEEWERRDEQARQCIVMTVDEENTSSLFMAESAYEMWECLKDVFQEKSVSNILTLKNEFFTYKKDPKQSMHQHIMKIKEMVYNLEAIGVKVDKNDTILVLLNSIPIEYRMVRTSLKTQSDLTIEMVCSRLKEEEKELGLTRATREKEAEEQAFIAKGGHHKWKKKVCYNCGKPGHLARDCRSQPMRKVNGEDSGRPMNGRQPSFTGVKCYSCDKYGHKSPECPEKRKTNQGNNAMVAEYFIESEALFRETTKEGKWIVDSGATHHICNDKSLFKTMEELTVPKKIRVGNKAYINATHIGTIEISLDVGEDTCKGVLGGVLFAPEIARNLFSVGSCVDAGNELHFTKHGVEIRNAENEVIAKGTKEDGLWSLSNKTSMEAHMAKENSDLDLWHERFGHLGEANLKLLKEKNMVNGFHPSASKLMPCFGCSEGKQTRLPSSKREQESTAILDLVHTDICGPISPTSIGGSRYFITFTDDFSRKCWTYCLKTKDEALDKFKVFTNLVETKSGVKLKCLRSDNGGEYTSKAWKDFCIERGIEQTFSAPYSPNQNGVAERLNRTLSEMARSMINSHKLDEKLWGEAIMTAAYLKNRSPHSSLEDITPEEAWSGRKPSVNHIRNFGCKTSVLIPKEFRENKLSSRVWWGVFVGYAGKKLGYRIWDPKRQRVYVRRDVKFYEDDFQHRESNDFLKSNTNKENFAFDFSVGTQKLTFDGENGETNQPTRSIVPQEEFTSQEMRESETMREGTANIPMEAAPIEFNPRRSDRISVQPKKFTFTKLGEGNVSQAYVTIVEPTSLEEAMSGTDSNH